MSCKTSVCKLCRREGVKLFLKASRCETSKCALTKRNFPPGQHPWARTRHSEYRTQLREKQRLKRFYGVPDEPQERKQPLRGLPISHRLVC